MRCTRNRSGRRSSLPTGTRILRPGAIANRAIAHLFPALRRSRIPPTGIRIRVQRAIALHLHIDQSTSNHISQGHKEGVRLRGHTPKIEFFPMRSSGSNPCIKRAPSNDGYLAKKRSEIHLTTVTDTLIIPSGIRGYVCHLAPFIEPSHDITTRSH